MRIGIDARPLRDGRVGIGNYVHGLVQRLPGAAPSHDYFLYSNREIDPSLTQPPFQRIVESAWGVIPGTVWLWSRGGNLARADRLDIYWSATPVLPRWMPPNVIKAVTVHDLMWRLLPETMSRHGLMFQRLFSEGAIRRSDLVIVNSRSTGEDVVGILGVDPRKIRLVYPGISDAFVPRDASTAAKYIARKYGVPTSYMAAVGTVEPRKNLSLLANALKILKDSGRSNCPLLVAGASGWKSSALFRNIREAGLSEKEIRFLGYIAQEDLPHFYAGAQLFLFPSLYEGFGFPPLEAMACGTPVIASSAKSMPEVLGDAALLQSPHDAEGFAAAISRVLGDENLRYSLRLAGIQQARKFRWESSVRQFLEGIEGARSKQSANSREEHQDNHVLQDINVRG